MKNIGDLLYNRDKHITYHKKGNPYAILIGGVGDKGYVKKCEHLNLEDNKLTDFGELNQSMEVIGAYRFGQYLYVYG